jgi:murein DD-endopeptidase MepM/ murein hydrolase activator NlpD
MRLTMKKYLIPLLLLVSVPLAAFNWPQDEIMSDSFYSYFGQLRGGTISTSLIFADTSDIRTADNGKVIAVISEYDDDSCFFPSTLGNAVILSHNSGNLLTVYGNIDGKMLTQNVYTADTVKAGSVLGSSGNSGWQQGRSSLEFQVIDTKNNTAVNPRVLMPRIGEELPLTLSGITLISKTGTRSALLIQRTLPSGLYRVYRRRQAVAIPYRTRITINGVIIDDITYDQLIQDGMTVCAAGRKNYPGKVLYPDDRLQLLGEVTLTPGKNTLGMTLTDILGKETTSAYSLTIY